MATLKKRTLKMTPSSVEKLFEELTEACAGHEQLQGVEKEDVESFVKILIEEQFKEDRKAAQQQIGDSVTNVVVRLMEAERDED